jgi:peroxiredoxin
MKYPNFLMVLLVCTNSFGQLKPIGIGDQFPNYILRPIINAPVVQFDVNSKNSKILIFNFWGTWCAPCIPEMDNLAKIQKANKDIQIIGISNDKIDRLNRYKEKKPSEIWLASDTSSYLYNRFGFSYVGQAAILNQNNKVIALVRSDSITQSMIDKIKIGIPIANSSQLITTVVLGENPDLFGIDSTTNQSLTIQSRKSDQGSMILTYKNTKFQDRRISFINLPDAILYEYAYKIGGTGRVIYLPDAKSLEPKIVSLDLIIPNSNNDSLRSKLKQVLQKFLPYQVSVVRKEIPVFVLRRKEPASSNLQESREAKSDYWFTGKGFSGTAIPLETFCNYLENELGLPVVDETNLRGRYDIKTVLTIRSKDEILKSVDAVGLKIEQTRKEMEVLVIKK